MRTKSLLNLAALPLVALLAANAPQAATPASGGQRIVSMKGAKCQMMVPAGWTANKFIKSDVSAPGDSASAVISYSDGYSTLATVKPIVQGFMKPVKTIEDTPQRLWFQYNTESNGGTGWYVGVPGHGGICGAQISFKNAAQADMARKIALSVGPSA